MPKKTIRPQLQTFTLLGGLKTGFSEFFILCPCTNIFKEMNYLLAVSWNSVLEATWQGSTPPRPSFMLASLDFFSARICYNYSKPPGGALNLYGSWRVSMFSYKSSSEIPNIHINSFQYHSSKTQDCRVYKISVLLTLFSTQFWSNN